MSLKPYGIRRFLLCAAAAAVVLLPPAAGAEELKTKDTVLLLEAGTRAPRLASLHGATKAASWVNEQDEPLVDTALVDGVQTPLTWKLQPHVVHTTSLYQAVYECASPHLRAVWEWRKRSDSGPLEHTITIQNLDAREVSIPPQPSVSFRWRTGSGRITRFAVEKGADSPSAQGVHRDDVGAGETWQGTSSNYAAPHPGEPREIIPFIAVEQQDGNGWYAGLEFSGRTRILLTRDDRALAAQLGLNPEPGPVQIRLRHGQKFQSPTVFVGAYDGGPDGFGNILRPWVREVLGNPRSWADPQFPVTVNNSWGSGMQVDEALAMRMLSDSQELGLEMFHLDAGWFRSVGDWTPDPKKFPHGLAPLAAEAHRRHLRFGLWMDWAQAGTSSEPGALNVHDPKVRDWLVAEVGPEFKAEEFKGQTIDIGVPAARQWAQSAIDRAVRDFKLDMFEHDGYMVAKGCDKSDHPHAAPAPAQTSKWRDAGFDFVEGPNSTDVSYRATRAYYAIYERLRRQHPTLLLEICNDGGRMVDFGTAAHGDYFSITDTYDPLSNRRAFWDTSFVMPAAMLESYVEKWPNAADLDSFRYMLRSGMMGWLSIMQDTTQWTPEQHDAAKKEIALYKSRLRPLIRDANLYHISERPDGVHWDAVEYFDPKLAQGVIYVFHGSDPTENSYKLLPKGLAPQKRYRLTSHDRRFTARTLRGSDLMKTGLTLSLPNPNSSDLIFLQEVRGK